MKKIFAMLYDFVDANAVYIVGDTLLATEINLKKQLANQKKYDLKLVIGRGRDGGA